MPHPKSESRRESPGIERHDSSTFSLYSSQEARGAFHLGKKPGNFGGSKSGISDWQKVVPFGRKGPRYVAVPDGGPGTGTNYEKRKMEHDIPFGNSNRENGTTFLDFPLFLEIFQWDEQTKRVPFTVEPEILTKWKAPMTLVLVRSCLSISGVTKTKTLEN